MKFKKLIIIAAFVLIVPCLSLAQMGYGIIAGLNMASFSGDDIDFFEDMGLDVVNRMTFAGGFFLKHNLSDNMAFRPEFIFSMKGAKYEVANADFDFQTKLTYLEVPLLLQLGLSTEGSIKPVILAGPYVAYLMSAKNVMEDDTEDIKDDVKSLDYGIVLGAAVVINDQFEIGARYSMGLSNVGDPEEGSGDPEKIKNKVIEIRGAFHLK